MKLNESFTGFNKDIFLFFSELEKNNNLEWFDENRSRYQKNIVQPTKKFIEQLSSFLNRLNPSIRNEPKFNDTIMRINKDLRFAKGEPYRNYWLIHFGRFKMDSEFFLFFEASGSDLGLFINRSKGDNLFFRKNLERYKKEISGVFEKYNLNKNYALFSLGKEGPKEVKKHFDANKDLALLEKMEMFILQKTVSKKTLFSSNIVFETIKTITQLYPLYCFCISQNPLKELTRFEEEFGELVE